LRDLLNASASSFILAAKAAMNASANCSRLTVAARMMLKVSAIEVYFES
jgi:hypothetical protein